MKYSYAYILFSVYTILLIVTGFILNPDKIEEERLPSVDYNLGWDSTRSVGMYSVKYSGEPLLHEEEELEMEEWMVSPEEWVKIK